MSEVNRPNQPPNERATRAEEPARADAALPMSGRSASVGEIGRELGDLDFDPDDLLASLRPFEPESDAPRLSVAEAEVALRADSNEAINIAAPRLPSEIDNDLPEDTSAPPSDGSLAPSDATDAVAPELGMPAAAQADEAYDAPFAQQAAPAESSRTHFEAEEPSTHALPVVPPVAPASPARPSMPKPPERRANAPRPIVTQTIAEPSATRGAAPSPHQASNSGAPLPPPPSEPHSSPLSHRQAPNSGAPLPPVPSQPRGAPVSRRQPPSRPSVPARRPSIEPKAAATSSHSDPHAPDVTTSDDPIALDDLLALPPQREQSITFERERPAHQHLQERGLTEAFGQIAEVLQRESTSARHAQEQIENALVISELHALMGDAGTGSKSVATLGPMAPSALTMQRRQLALSAADLTGYAHYLKTDVRAPSSHEGRRHVMALYADVVRLVLEDDIELKKHLELSLRACPSDARFWIHKSLAILLEQQSGAKPRSLTIPESPKLTDALRDLSALRADATNTTHPAGALRALTNAWKQRDLNALLVAIDALRELDSMSAAASWLYASMTIFLPEYRQRGTQLLEALLEGGELEADLALLERRLHDSQALPNSVEAFAHPCVSQLSAVDRLTLGLAVDADNETIRVLADAAANRPNALALVRAVQHVQHLTCAADNDNVPSLRWQLGTQLGRAPDAGSADTTLPSWWSCLERLEALTPDAALVRLLRWVSTMSRGNGEPMAQALLQLAEELEPVESATLLGLTALLAELVNTPSLREQSLELAAAIGLPLESVQRSIMSMNDAIGANAVLQRWRDRLPSSLERTLVDLELCAAEEVPRASILAILKDCLSTQPTLVALAAVLGAASTSGARQIWPALVQHATSALAQRLSIGLDWFETHSLGAGDTTDADPLELGFGPPSLKIVLSQLEDLIANSDVNSSMWQKVKTLSGSVPFDITQTDTSIWEQDQSQQSPLVDHWRQLSIAVRGGESSAFDEQLTTALALEEVAAVDRMIDASALDPQAIATLGSARAAQAILEKQARNLFALRIQLRHLAQTGPLHEVGKVAAQIAQQLDQSMRLAHAWLAITSTNYANDADSNLEAAIHLDSLIRPSDTPPTWASRRLFSLAQARRDDRGTLEHANRLRETSTRAMDTATLTLRAAEAASRLELWDVSLQLLDRTVDLCPEHLVALSMRAEFLEARGDVERAGSAYDALATAACMPTHKVAAWVQAASLWTDANQSVDAEADQGQSRRELADKALVALEHAVELDPTHVEANARLKNEYLARGDLEKLELLLTRQLLRVDGTDKRAELELDRAKTLADLGRIDEAQSGLERALSLIPDHVPALLLSAQLHEKRMDFEAAEQQWLLIASHSLDAELQLEAYRRLAVLYETYLEMPARAEVACREVLRRCPNDPIAERLAQLLLRQDNPNGAIELLEQLVSSTQDQNLERTYTLELARIFDEVTNDRRRAEAALDGARRRWPHDVATLRALAAFFTRGKDQAAYSTLLDRSLMDARRALGTGRFDVSFFEVIACVAELRDETETMAAARGTLDALMARDSDLTGLGLDAASDAYSDWLAPEVLSLPLRALLRRSGFALCAAHPIDLRALRVTPLEHTHADLAQRLQEWARSFGLSEVVLYVSPALGAVCQPIASTPATLVIGQAYLKLEDERVQEALALRALRVLSANAAAFANTAPMDLWPLLVGYLSTYLPDWLPPGVDAAKNAAIRDRIQKAMPQSTDRDLPMLAADVAASIGNRGSQLGIAVQQWGSRTALLALGSPSTLLSSIATANGQQERLGTDPAERQKWLLRNPEARDLVVFSVSDPYLQARAQGLTRR